jgi:hypothetical protein
MALPLSQFAVHLRPSDNIAVTARPIPPETDLSFEGATVHVPATIKMGHKFAVRPIKEGDAVLKFGQTIGFAARNIGVGEHVHSSGTMRFAPICPPRSRHQPNGGPSWATTVGQIGPPTSAMAPGTTSPSSVR